MYKEKKIKILLVGYGKMGRMIEDNADFVGGEVVAVYDPAVRSIGIDSLDSVPADIDVAIEFTSPASGYDNVCTLLSQRIPVVTGTTGWFHRIDELKTLFDTESHTLIYGANFSVGMNLFYAIVSNATSLIAQTGVYDIYGFEAHHKHKVDAPSGTAKVLESIVNKYHPSENLFTALRAGSIVGLHELGYDSDFDEIKLVHNAKSRKGFAMGALLAAKYAIAHSGVHDFQDIFTQCLSING